MDTEYIIDGAFELGELTALEVQALRSLPAAYARIRQCIDASTETSPQFLIETAQTALGQLSRARRARLALAALPELGLGLQSLAARTEHIVLERLQVELGESAPEVRLRLRLPEVGALAVLPAVRCEQEVSAQHASALAQALCGDARRRWVQALQGCEQALAQYLAGELPLSAPAEEPVPVITYRERGGLVRRQLRRAKGAIRKASRLFCQLGYERELRLLVSGQEVVLAHRDSPLKFVVQAPSSRNWLIERTAHCAHTVPYTLSVLTRDDVLLGRLCVYFDETPVLDQLLALALHVASGNEERILMQANWTLARDCPAPALETALHAYPALAQHLGRCTEPLACPGELDALALVLRPASPVVARLQGPVRAGIEQWCAPLQAQARRLIERIQVLGSPQAHRLLGPALSGTTLETESAEPEPYPMSAQAVLAQLARASSSQDNVRFLVA